MAISLIEKSSYDDKTDMQILQQIIDPNHIKIKKIKSSFIYREESAENADFILLPDVFEPSFNEK